MKKLSRRNRWDGAPRDDRGAVFVEFALLVPVLLLLAIGIVEYGMGWKSANDVNSAARDGARSGTSASNYQTADRSVIYSIANNLQASGDISGVQKIIIFNASSANSSVPSACLALANATGTATSAGSPQGISGVCNVYGPGQLTYILASPGGVPNATVDGPWVNSGATGCDSGDVDSKWCPATRNHSQSSNSFDYLGVYIKLKHSSVSGFSFGNQTIERTAVFRLEPTFGGE